MFRKVPEGFDGEGVKEPTFARAGAGQGLPPTDVQQTYFELTRARPWRSLALVPVDEEHLTMGLAHQLAQMASLDPRNRVLVVNATGVVGSEPAFSKGPPPAVGANGAVAVANGRYALLDCAKLGLDDATIGMVEVPKQLEAMRAGAGPYTMVIVATNSLLSRPAAVATARAVDAVVLCPILGESSFRNAKRTIDLIGEEHVAGTVVIRR